MAKFKRIHRVISSLPPLEGGDRFILDTLTYRDALGRPFECEMLVLSHDHSIDEEQLLGTGLTVRYEAKEGQVRHINGIVADLSYMGVQDEFSVYRIGIRPWFWFLNHNFDNRIFQEVSVKDIVDVLFKETHGFTDYKLKLTRSYPQRTYCVQYGESDFNFMSRLLEEEGIYYHFEHEEKKHTMVLLDDPASHQKHSNSMPSVPFRRPGDASPDMQNISAWQVRSQVRPTKVTLQDFDFEKPRVNLETNAIVKKKHKLSKFERYQYPGRYDEKEQGNRLAGLRAEEYQADFTQFSGSTNVTTFATGFQFKMKDHPRKDQNDRDYLITDLEMRIESAEIAAFSGRENRFDLSFAAVEGTQRFRTACTAERPRITGPQSAIVVGKSGEEIWTDQHGRVKVQFPWDRIGEKDENSSCWIRVSQNWAGKSWGSIHIPRIGQEVLVEFLEGNPDRPIITGRVYNADQTTPYDLPSNQTQSGVKTQSSKQAKRENFNELRFEDKKGKEEIYLHAEKDFTHVVENNASMKVGFDKRDKGNQTIEVLNDRTLTVAEGNESIEISQGNREVVVKLGKEAFTIHGDRSIRVKAGNHSTQVDAGKCTITAMQSIELKVGGSVIKIDPAKISISAPTIAISGNATAKLESPATTVSGGGALNLTGSIVKIN